MTATEIELLAGDPVDPSEEQRSVRVVEQRLGSPEQLCLQELGRPRVAAVRLQRPHRVAHLLEASAREDEMRLLRVELRYPRCAHERKTLGSRRPSGNSMHAMNRHSKSDMLIR